MVTEGICLAKLSLCGYGIISRKKISNGKMNAITHWNPYFFDGKKRK